MSRKRRKSKEQKQRSRPARVLLSQCFQPWGIDDEYTTPMLNYEGWATNFSNRDGIWTPRGICNEIANHFIATNIEAPTVVLDNPTLEDFKKECLKGYDYIGISAMTMTIKKVKRMLEVAGEVSPKSKTVLGGYVTQTPGVDELNVDFICQEEGASFFRRLLGERPIKRYENPPSVLFTQNCYLFHPEVRHPFFRHHFLTLGLGCPRGCHFCSSTAYYRNHYIPLLKTGQEIFDAIMKTGDISGDRRFVIFEDNFTLLKERNLEILELARSVPDKPIFYFCFADIASTMTYDPEVLVEMGVDIIFIGVETQVGRIFNRAKHGGLKPREIRRLFASLREAGIQTVAASIITGTDEHSLSGYLKDLRFHLSLNSTYSQFAPAIAMPGTPYWKQCLNEGRILLDHNTVDFDLKEWTSIASDSRLAQAYPRQWRIEVGAQAFHAFIMDQWLNGPGLFRALEVKLHAARKYRNSNRPVLRAKAEVHRKDCLEAYPFVLLCRKPGLELSMIARKRVGRLAADFTREFGPPNYKMRDRLEHLYSLALAEKERQMNYFGGISLPSIEAPMVRTTYRCKDRRAEA